MRDRLINGPFLRGRSGSDLGVDDVVEGGTRRRRRRARAVFWRGVVVGSGGVVVDVVIFLINITHEVFIEECGGAHFLKARRGEIL